MSNLGTVTPSTCVSHDHPSKLESLFVRAVVHPYNILHLPIMRLINVKSMELEEFFDESIPRYAILSHTWTTDEVLYKDFQEDELDTSNPRSAKIVGCCTQAALDGQQYVWVCTMSKSSSESRPDSCII